MISYIDIRPLLKDVDPDGSAGFSQLSGDALANLMCDVIRAKIPTFTMSDSTRASLTDLMEVMPIEKIDYFFAMIRKNNTIITASCFVGFLLLDIRSATRALEAQKDNEEKVPEEFSDNSGPQPSEWRPQPTGFDPVGS